MSASPGASTTRASCILAARRAWANSAKARETSPRSGYPEGVTSRTAAAMPGPPRACRSDAASSEGPAQPWPERPASWRAHEAFDADQIERRHETAMRPEQGTHLLRQRREQLPLKPMPEIGWRRAQGHRGCLPGRLCPQTRDATGRPRNPPLHPNQLMSAKITRGQMVLQEARRFDGQKE